MQDFMWNSKHYVAWYLVRCECYSSILYLCGTKKERKGSSTAMHNCVILSSFTLLPRTISVNSFLLYSILNFSSFIQIFFPSIANVN